MDRRSFLGRIGGLVAGGVAAALGKNVIAEEPEKTVIPGCDKDADLLDDDPAKEIVRRALDNLGDQEFKQIDDWKEYYLPPNPTHYTTYYTTDDTMPAGIGCWIENTA